MRLGLTLAALLLSTGCATGSYARGSCSPCPPCPCPCPSDTAAAPVATATATVTVAPVSPAPGAPAPAATPAAVRTAKAPLGAIVGMRSGNVVAFDAMVDRLMAGRVVYVGEMHDQALHHAFQAKVLEAVVARAQGPVALGLEMFFRPFQPVLDAYVKGEIDEATMLERTEWKTRWGFGWEMYAPMLRLCREKRLPVIALNAPKEITRTVSKKGLDGLTPEQRATLPTLDLNDAEHRAFVKEAFGAHGASMPPETFEKFYTSMVIWDEVMSSSVASWLEQAGPGAIMVVVAGNGHIENRWGIPGRAERKTKLAYKSIVQEVGGAGEEDGIEVSAKRADFAVRWAPSAPPKPKHPEVPAAPKEPAKDAPAAEDPAKGEPAKDAPPAPEKGPEGEKTPEPAPTPEGEKAPEPAPTPAPDSPAPEKTPEK